MDIEIANRNSEKFIPHPILDDPIKMMRIIANPVYNKLTLSRAAHIRKRNSVHVNRPREKTMVTPLKSLNNDETIITPLPTNNTQPQLKSVSKRQNPPPIGLLTRSSTNRILPKNFKSSARSSKSSLHSPFTDNDKKSDGTIRYVNSRYGLEVQRYSSPNWLSIDLLTKDACESEEKTFRDMIDKKEQNEQLSRSIFTSDYYRQRWEDLLQSNKDGHLTHDEWAKQNYQLYCLKTFYTQAFEREQYRMDLREQNQRQKRAQCVFNEWKEAKGEGNIERHRSHSNTANSQRTSVISNPSYSHHNNTKNRVSISSTVVNNSSKNPRITSKTPWMLDEQRWSLQAMLKRVVGLAEPLPPPPKINTRLHSALTNLSNDSGFESGL